MPRFQRRYRLCGRWWVYYTINTGHAQRKQRRAASCQPYLNIVAIIFLFFLLLLCCNNDKKVLWGAAAYRESKIPVGCVSYRWSLCQSVLCRYLSFLQWKCSPQKTAGSHREYSRADNIWKRVHTCANHEDSFLFFRKDLLKRLHTESSTKHCYMELCLHWGLHPLCAWVCVCELLCEVLTHIHSEDLSLLLLQNAIFYLV